jgi:hypothetical protein
LDAARRDEGVKVASVNADVLDSAEPYEADPPLGDKALNEPNGSTKNLCGLLQGQELIHGFPSVEGLRNLFSDGWNGLSACRPHPGRFASLRDRPSADPGPVRHPDSCRCRQRTKKEMGEWRVPFVARADSRRR